MRKKPTETDKRYARFLARRKGIYDSLASEAIVAEIQGLYGNPDDLVAWDAENAELFAEYQQRLEAELEGAVPTEQAVHIQYQKELARCRN